MGRQSLIITLCATLLFASLAGVASAETRVKDIAADHPSYKAVVGLVEKGYLSLYQDGSFQGGLPVDRYTLATVVAKILADIQSGRLVLPAEEMKTLRQLATEFRAELVEVAGRVNAQSQAQEKLNSEMAILREDGTRVLGEVYQIQGEIARLNADVQRLTTDLEATRTETAKAAQEREAGLLEKNLALTSRIEALEKQLTSDLMARLSADAARSKALEASHGELRAEFDSYRRSSESEVGHLKTTNRWLSVGLAVLGLLALSR